MVTDQRRGELMEKLEKAQAAKAIEDIEPGLVVATVGTKKIKKQDDFVYGIELGNNLLAV